MAGQALAAATAEQRIRALPCWRGRIALAPLDGGLSNAAFRVETADGLFVARLGPDYPVHGVSRAAEAAASRAAAACGLSPPVLYAGDGALVCRFVEGRTLEAADMRGRIADVAALLRRSHAAMSAAMAGAPARFDVFAVIRSYCDRLTRDGHAWRGDCPGWLARAAGWEAAQPALAPVFAHNDLLPANLIDDGARLWLIDWEYAGFGAPLFDLANCAGAAGFSDAQGAALLAGYFGASQTSPGASQTSPGALRRAFAAMRLASALREALWAAVSSLHLDAPGADYAAYARTCRDTLEALLAGEEA